MKEILSTDTSKKDFEVESTETKSIAKLWEESEKIRQQIISSPFKHPLKYLHIILFEGK